MKKKLSKITQLVAVLRLEHRAYSHQLPNIHRTYYLFFIGLTKVVVPPIDFIFLLYLQKSEENSSW